MNKKRASKKSEGKRLNDEGALSSLAVFQKRMEHYFALANEEMEKGELGSRELIGEYLKLGQEAAEALAPYRHARLTPKDQQGDGPRRYVVRLGDRSFKKGELDEHGNDAWLAWAKSLDQSSQTEADKAEEILRRLKDAQPAGSG